MCICKPLWINGICGKVASGTAPGGRRPVAVESVATALGAVPIACPYTQLQTDLVFAQTRFGVVRNRRASLYRSGGKRQKHAAEILRPENKKTDGQKPNEVKFGSWEPQEHKSTKEETQKAQTNQGFSLRFLCWFCAFYVPKVLT